MKLILDYPDWVYFICLLVGIVFSFLLYYKERQLNQPKWLYRVLFTLRFFIAFLVSFLLFNPQLYYKRKHTEKPIVAIVYDNSQSAVLNKDSLEIKQLIDKTLPSFFEEFSGDYNLKSFTFGEELKIKDSLSYSDKITDLSTGLSSLNDRFYNQNLAAVFLVTDGIINEGNNPLYQSDLPQAKIYSIALGDTTAKQDIGIINVEHNNIAFLNNKFPVKVVFKANKLKGKAIILDLYNGDKKIVSKTRYIESENYSADELFLIEASSVGVQKFTIKLNQFSNEQTYLNNAYDFFVEVLNSKQNILLLANAPHPDIAAINSSLKKNESYQIDVRYMYDLKDLTTPYDVILLHNLPFSSNPLLEKLLLKNTPKLFVVGTQTNLNLLQKYYIQIPNNNSYSDAGVEINSLFSLFTLNTSNITFSKLPPLKVPFATKYGVNTQNILMYQIIGNAKTNYPLMGFYQSENSKFGYILGEGLWRWKMAEYQSNKTTPFFDDLIQKTFQYLTVKEDKSRFRVFTQKNTFYNNEEVVINAELYNKSYQLVNASEVALELKNDKGEKYKYQFSKSGNKYTLNLGKLPSESYHYVAKTNLGPETFVKDGAFVVNVLQKENLNLQANHSLLKQLSEKTGGQLIYPTDISKIKELLNNTELFPSVVRYEETTDSLLNLWGLLCLIIILVSSEWFLRKYFGSY